MNEPRPTYIGVSTKMYLGYQVSLDWMAAVAAEVEARPGLAAAGVVPFVAPSYPVLESALRILTPAGVMVGAQDASDGDGPLTGEVSAAMLAEMGVRLVEVGHAERRRMFGETDDVVAAKVAAVQASGMLPLLCVGEGQNGDPDAAVRHVVAQCWSAVGDDPARLACLVIAYEPLWAIGAPQPAPADYVNAVIAGIRSALSSASALSSGSPAIPPIVYGGSAGPGLLTNLPEADGLFLGRFAHDPANVARVLDEALARVTVPELVEGLVEGPAHKNPSTTETSTP